MGEKINISFLEFLGTEIEFEDEYAREQLAGETAARTEDVAVLEARMDTFTALPAGSTAGDAELMDIRVGADGATYANAGDAVRGQVSNLNSELSDLQNDIVTTYFDATWVQNRVAITNNVLAEITGTTFIHSNFITMTEDLTIEVPSGFTLFGWRCAYNEFGHAGQDALSRWSSGTINISFNSNLPYLVLCVQKNPSAVIVPSDASGISIYSEHGTIFALKSDVAELETQVSQNTEDVESASAELTALENTGTDGKTHTVPMTFSSGRVTVSSSTVTVATNSSFAYMKYAELKKGVEYTLNIPSGLDVYAYILNFNDDTYTRLLDFTPWTSGNTSVSYTIETVMQGYYLVLSVKKTAGGAITAEEASAITVTYTSADYVSIVSELKFDTNKSTFSNVPTGGQILYLADNESSSDYIVNALAYDDGVIIACRSNGRVVRIGYDGTEELLLEISGSGFDWRLCWKDSNDNVYVSPHASWGSMNVGDRGLYRLTKGESSFVKVLALYNESSSVTTETQNNDDTIWTMCEDGSGNLYAGVYAHTIRENPSIYKSTNGGVSWTRLINFNVSRYTSGGKHIHTVVYSKWKNALYCIVGEINTIFKSNDGGSTWENLNIELRAKGSALLPVQGGLLVGSDGAYNCEIDFVFNDDKTHETVFSGWANTVFGIRCSDVTGFIYAFTKIDSSVSSDQYYPPYGVLYGTKTVEAWKNGDYTSGTAPTHLQEWENYNASVSIQYPNDAIRPQHFSILVSRDGGLHWEVLKAIPCDSRTAYGIWTIGQFKNGECLCGVYTGNYINGSFETFVTGVSNPIVISEGKHKYTGTGCELDGEIFVRTNTSSIVEQIT